MDMNDIILSNLCLSENGNVIRIDNTPISWVGRKDGYIFCSINKKTVYMHRALWVLNFGPLLSGQEIDHIDNNPSNNTLSNLRICRREENCQNTKIRRDNTSGVKGVFWDNFSKSWRVSIWKDKKKHDLGRFKSFAEAEKAANDARLKIHKEFANIGTTILEAV